MTRTESLRASWGPVAVAMAMVVALSAALPDKGASYLVYIAGLAGINIVLAVSLTIVNGFTGQFSLGHAGFMAVGGYAAAAVTVNGAGIFDHTLTPQIGAQVLFLAGTLLGGVAAAMAGFVVGLPSLRLRGDYLAIVTLGFGEIIRVVIENTAAIGGATGMTGIPATTSIFWVLLWVVLTVGAAKRIRESANGRALLAIREDEIAAEATGINTTRYKVTAFVLSSFFAGVAGALLGHYLQILTPKDFTFVRSIEVVAMVVLGGQGSVTGSILAAVILTVAPEALRPLMSYTGVDLRIVIYSLILIVLMIGRPQGLFGTREVWKEWDPS